MRCHCQREPAGSHLARDNQTSHDGLRLSGKFHRGW